MVVSQEYPKNSEGHKIQLGCITDKTIQMAWKSLTSWWSDDRFKKGIFHNSCFLGKYRLIANFLFFIFQCFVNEVF